MIYIIMIVLFISFLVLIRIELVARVEMKALKQISILSNAAIYRNEPWEVYYDQLNEISYNKKMIQLWKWRFKDFYPNL